MAETEVKTTYERYGIGRRIGNEIRLNQYLKDYPVLHDLVLQHELKHFTGKKNVDWQEPFNLDLFTWTLKHPSSWLQVLPLRIDGDVLAYSWTLIYLWVFVIAWAIFLFVFVLGVL